MALTALLFPPRQQIPPDQLVQIAVQHAIDIADLDPRAQVLHHAVRLQHIRTDLRAEVDVELRIFNVLGLCALLLQLVFVEPRAQNAHRLLAVLVLRALVLAGDHNARSEYA